MEHYENVAWNDARPRERLNTERNLSALMARDDRNTVLIPPMEDFCPRRPWRLAQALEEVRQGCPKIKKYSERSRYMYENKQHMDKIAGTKTDI